MEERKWGKENKECFHIPVSLFSLSLSLSLSSLSYSPMKSLSPRSLVCLNKISWKNPTPGKGKGCERNSESPLRNPSLPNRFLLFGCLALSSSFPSQ